MAWHAPVLLVPWVCDPVSLAGREGRGHVGSRGVCSPDSSSPEPTPDPLVHGGGPLPSLKGAVCFPGSNRIPTFAILSGVFTPISPKPI